MINPTRLQQARELRGWTQTAMAQQVGVHQSAIAQLETGRIQPSPAVLDAISRATGFPPAFFTRPSGLAFPPGSLRFRARAAMTARQRRQAFGYAHTLYELMASMAARVELPAPCVPRLAGDPVAAARLTREALGLASDQPIGPLIRTLERGGVWVVAIPVPLPRREAFSAWAGGDAATPVIVVTATTAGDRRRFSVAHELGHLVLHQLPQGSPHGVERQADRFAAAFLMPEAAMRTALVPPVTLTTLAPLKAGWGVSLQALIRRAHTLEIITPSQYRSLHAQLGARGWRIQEPLSVPVERPRALRQLAELLYGRPIDYPSLADATGLTPAFVQDLLEAHAAGGGPSLRGASPG